MRGVQEKNALWNSHFTNSIQSPKICGSLWKQDVKWLFPQAQLANLWTGSELWWQTLMKMKSVPRTLVAICQYFQHLPLARCYCGRCACLCAPIDWQLAPEPLRPLKIPEPSFRFPPQAPGPPIVCLSMAPLDGPALPFTVSSLCCNQPQRAAVWQCKHLVFSVDLSVFLHRYYEHSAIWCVTSLWVDMLLLVKKLAYCMRILIITSKMLFFTIQDWEQIPIHLQDSD